MTRRYPGRRQQAPGYRLACGHPVPANVKRLALVWNRPLDVWCRKCGDFTKLLRPTVQVTKLRLR